MDTSNLFRVNGMAAVVTCGATGIGFMMAKALSGAGAKKVYILGRRKEALERAASHHEAITPVVYDVTSKVSLQFAVDFIANETGFINLLIANSGIPGPWTVYDPDLTVQETRTRMFENSSMEEFTKVYNVNVTGAYFTMLAFLELLGAGNQNAVKGGFGAPSALVPMFLRFRVSESATAHLTKHASTNLERYEIRVNGLLPGFFHSEMSEAIISSRTPGEEALDNKDYIPVRRFGGDGEMAGSVLYHASRAGSFRNGLMLLNDGGRIFVMNSEY